MHKTNHSERSVTLAELMVAVALLGLLVVGIFGLENFAKYHLLTSDRRARVQNDASYLLEHLTGNVFKAIGDVDNCPVDTTTPIEGDTAIRIWVDKDNDGRRDAEGQDDYVAYRFTATNGTEDTYYQIWYYDICRGANCNQTGSTAAQVLVRTIPVAPNYVLQRNFLNVRVTVCWDPDGVPEACGDINNPQIVMRTRLAMPSYSIR